MCGICGFISRKTITLDQLKQINDTMYHRGPNDSGEEIFPLKDGYALGLAQRRLAILDLSALGHQPMHSDNGRVSVVYNGEIYNFQELKEELKDYPFKSDCDTEVIIAGYLKWGIDCINRFKGMFAIALFDRETNDLYLVRDRIGKKPLYYWMESGNIVFASELKPFMALEGFPFQIRQDVIKQYMFQQYINAPATIFENVYKLEPGAILQYHYGEVKIWKYWDIAKVYEEQSRHQVKSYEEAKATLKDLLRTSVKNRMIADVPLGTFLSGGYDSSLVSAIAQELSSEPVKTFCIGFKEERYNEAKYAREVAAHLGTNHTETYIDEAEMFDLVESIPRYFDEPFADSSQIPTMLVSKLAREKVTVALSGDGGDEFYCGYNIYENVATAQKIDLLGAMVDGLCKLPPLKQMHAMDKLPFRVRVVATNRNPETKTQIGGENYIKAVDQMLNGEALPSKFEIESKYGVKDWQVRRMLLDMDTYLPGDILCKVDRASMKYSLESRCPILDTDVMEYSYRIPHQFKFANGDKKHILKEIAYDYIPKELLDRPKVGFGVPLDKWLRGPLKEQLTEMSDLKFLREQGIFNSDYVHNFIMRYLQVGDRGPATGENFSKTAWSYFMFQQWYMKYMRFQSSI
ncbi:MAG: asparagine synthase (glutamine-hydrolyzing) [Lachnospiraceae bacterium]|nr:asparagine synthase (glutamine-hydrolyzing) [Lachnospiraceae bacterium]